MLQGLDGATQDLHLPVLIFSNRPGEDCSGKTRCTTVEPRIESPCRSILCDASLALKVRFVECLAEIWVSRRDSSPTPVLFKRGRSNNICFPAPLPCANISLQIRKSFNPDCSSFEQVEENLQKRSVLHVCKCKRAYSSVAWRMCERAREPTEV